MANRISHKPSSFRDWRDEEYWHAAQDIAYRAGAALELRDGASWLISDDAERLLCKATDRIWFETWLILQEEFPALSQIFATLRTNTKRGD